MPSIVNGKSPKGALHAIALFEAVKGVAALAASFGLLRLAHHDLRQLAFALIGRFHFDPEGHYPQLLLNYAQLLENKDLRAVVLFAWFYAAVRLAEGYGLWRDRAWAEWLAALSGAIYLPFEADHLFRHTSAVNVLVLAGNLCVVIYMIIRLRRRRLARVERLR